MMNARNNQSTFLMYAAAAAACVLLIFAFAVSCILGFAFDRTFYAEEYAKLNSAAYAGVSDSELIAGTELLLGYLEGKRDSLDFSIDTSAGKEEYYTEREKLHMEDVRELYQDALGGMIVFYIAGAALLCAVVLQRRRNAVYPILRAYFWSALGVFVFFGTIAAAASYDFNDFWIRFHKAFFTNDLWLLDPAHSRMIRMFEQDFFADLVTRILALFLPVLLGTMMIAGIYCKKRKKS